MASTITRSALRTRIRRWADIEGDTARFPDADLNDEINESAKRWHSKMVTLTEGKPYTTSSAISLVAGTATVALPATCFRLMGVDLSVYGETRTLHRWTFGERNRWAAPGGDAPPVAYDVRGSSLYLFPTPDVAYSGVLWFVPGFTELTGDSDTVDGLDGFESWIAWDVAIKCLIKDQRDASEHRERMLTCEREIRETVRELHLGAPAVSVDVLRDVEW